MSTKRSLLPLFCLAGLSACANNTPHYNIQPQQRIALYMTEPTPQLYPVVIGQNADPTGGFGGGSLGLGLLVGVIATDAVMDTSKDYSNTSRSTQFSNQISTLPDYTDLYAQVLKDTAQILQSKGYMVDVAQNVMSPAIAQDPWVFNIGTMVIGYAAAGYTSSYYPSASAELSVTKQPDMSVTFPPQTFQSSPTGKNTYSFFSYAHLAASPEVAFQGMSKAAQGLSQDIAGQIMGH